MPVSKANRHVQSKDPCDCIEEISLSHRTEKTGKGTTSVVPLKTPDEAGFSPEVEMLF